MKTTLPNKILEQLNTLIISVNKYGAIEYVSPSIKKSLGYEPKNLLNEGWWNFSRKTRNTHFIQKSEIVTLLTEQNTEPVAFERQLKTADGTSKWILFNLTIDENKTVLGIGYDITDRKLIQLQLDAKHAEIAKAYQNNKLLSEIGQEIISTLNFETIFQKLCASVNKLMNAECFGVRIFHEDQNAVEYKFEMENNVVIESLMVSMQDENNYTVWCLKNKTDIFLSDNQNEYHKYVSEIKVVSGDMPHSLLFTRMMVGEKTIGVITVQSFKKYAYQPYHLDMLRTLGTYTAIALENAALYHTLEERVEQRTSKIKEAYENTKLLGQISEDIKASLSVELITEKIYTNINKLMVADCFGIGIYNPATHNLEFSGFVENEVKMADFSYRIDDTERLAVLCFNSQKNIIINNFSEEYINYFSVLQEPVSGKHSLSIIYLPILSQENVIGVITVQSFQKNAYSDYQLSILENLALSIGVSLDNAALYQRMEEKVKERTQEVSFQKAIIEEKNKDITDSILYAKKIQLAIIPDDEGLKKIFDESFIYYKPKDIVSGDFYWFHRKQNKIFVAAIDCTGHGVPGAIMSVIGNGLIRDAIIKKGCEDPGDILRMIDQELHILLSKDNGETATADGMDIALAVFDFDTNILRFAGAFRPLLLIRKNDLKEIKGSRYPIGFYQAESKKFTTESIPFQRGDKYYLFTDGYIDQFGGKNNKKLNRHRFYDLLTNSIELSMDEQQAFLDYSLNNWKQHQPQTDDILVIGIKV